MGDREQMMSADICTARAAMHESRHLGALRVLGRGPALQCIPGVPHKAVCDVADFSSSASWDLTRVLVTLHCGLKLSVISMTEQREWIACVGEVRSDKLRLSIRKYNLVFRFAQTGEARLRTEGGVSHEDE